MTDYDRIEKIILYLDNHYTKQPSLDDMASMVGLSVSRFHRLFNSWAGITPKQFLKFLTAEDAKARLRDSASILDASIEVGLSGPGRLHDLFVSLEGVTPGEFKNGGEGLTIRWGSSECFLGRYSLGWTERGICHLAFHGNGECSSLPQALAMDWPNANFEQADSEAEELANKIFTEYSAPNEPLRLWVRATPFQLQVWKALLRIPEGRVCTYGQVAKAIGNPRAARAVGTACGSNPVGYLIPCHRVIRGTGIVDGYRWGNPRKKAILSKEAACSIQSDKAGTSEALIS
ncbi:MAG: methylated-DNA--[protein]-cysteine S-methyltransferase [Verrucomicrobiota bacterium]